MVQILFVDFFFSPLRTCGRWTISTPFRWEIRTSPPSHSSTSAQVRQSPRVCARARWRCRLGGGVGAESSVVLMSSLRCFRLWGLDSTSPNAGPAAADRQQPPVAPPTSSHSPALSLVGFPPAPPRLAFEMIRREAKQKKCSSAERERHHTPHAGDQPPDGRTEGERRIGRWITSRAT